MKRFVVFLAGNKVGKTTIGSAVARAHSYGYWYFLVPDLRLDPVTGDLPARETVSPEFWIRRPDGVPIAVPNTGMVVTGLTRERGIGQIIWPCMSGLLPEGARDTDGGYRVSKGPQGVVTQETLPNGSTVIYASADQDVLTFEGTRIQWGWADEPIKPFVFNGMLRGLALDMGPMWFTLTPLGADAAWMYTKFVLNPAEDCGVVKAGLDANPYFTGEARDAFIRAGEWTEAEKRARLYGDFESLGNRAIHTWDTATHVVPAHRLPVEWVHGVTVDPHHVRPPYVLWWKRSPDGIYHFYREWPTSDFRKQKSGGLAPTDLAILIRNLEGADVSRIRIGDPRFGKAVYGQQGHTAKSPWADQMRDAGMPFDCRVPDTGRVEIGEQKICDMLRWDRTYPICPTNTPHIFVHDCCKNLIASFENYGILPSRDPTRGEPEKRSEEYKDPIDAVRYTVLFRIPADMGSLAEVFTDEDWRNENYGESWYHT